MSPARRISTRVRAALPCGALTTAALLTGCSAAVDPAELAACDPATGGLVIVAGVHQNGPAPDVPEDLGCLIESTVLHRMPVTVISLDGTPRTELSAATFPVRTGNEAAARKDAQAGVAAVVGAVRGAAADSDGADAVAALALAHDAAVAGGTPEATVAVVDPLVPDTGVLQLTAPGWIGAQPSDVADFLEAQGNLPPAEGLSYLLYGVGYTAPPQEPLTPAARADLTALWAEVLERAGAAEVVAVPVPRGGDGPDTDYTTNTVPVVSAPQPEPCTAAPLVYENGSAVGFIADRTDVREPARAAEALAGVAAWLRADPTRHAEVLGTTADVGPRDGQLALSRARAASVVALLVELGAAPGQVHGDGAGSDFAGYLPDLDDPVARQANRSVRITLTGPSSC